MILALTILRTLWLHLYLDSLFPCLCISYLLHVVFRPWGNRIEWEEEQKGGALTCEQSVAIEYFLAVSLIFRIYRRRWRWFPWGWRVRRRNVRLSGKRVTRKRRRYFQCTLGKEHRRNRQWRGWGRATDKSRLVYMHKVFQGLINKGQNYWALIGWGRGHFFLNQGHF